MVEPLTAEEKKWLKQFQSLMNRCPSRRLGAFTIGDPDLTIYDKEVFDDYRFNLESCAKNQHSADRDDVEIHHELGTVLAHITMPFPVDGVCG